MKLKNSLAIRFSNIMILCLGLALFQGVAFFVGISTMLFQIIIDMIVIFIFFTAFLFKRERLVAPALGLFLFFSIIVILSGLINQSDFYTVFRMYRNTLIPYILFLSVLNLPLNDASLKRVNNFIFAMLFVQIIAAILKYNAYGVEEGKIIGTFSLTAGAKSTIFPLLAIIFLLALYFIYNKRFIYLFLIIGFIFMAWGGGKRAFVFVLPVFMTLTYFLYYKYEFNIGLFNLRNILKIAIMIAIIMPFIYIYATNTPSLNPEHKYGGSFDINHLIEFAISYQTDEHAIVGNPRFQGQTVILGRHATLMRAIEYTTNDAVRFFFGYGPDITYATARGDEQRLRFGVVEFQTGVSIYIISIGFLGAIILYMIYFKIAITCIKNYHGFSKYWRALTLGVFVSAFVLLYDYLFYSQAFIHGLIPSMLFFYLGGAIIKVKELDKKAEIISKDKKSA